MVKSKKASTESALSETAPASRQQTADYIATMSNELSGMAERDGLPFLKYLLDMTVEEAMRQGGMPGQRRTGRAPIE